MTVTCFGNEQNGIEQKSKTIKALSVHFSSLFLVQR